MGDDRVCNSPVRLTISSNDSYIRRILPIISMLITLCLLFKQ